MVVKFIYKLVLSLFKMKDIGYPFGLNNEIIKLISIFSNETENQVYYYSLLSENRNQL